MRGDGCAGHIRRRWNNEGRTVSARSGRLRENILRGVLAGLVGWGTGIFTDAVTYDILALRGRSALHQKIEHRGGVGHFWRCSKNGGRKRPKMAPKGALEALLGGKRTRKIEHPPGFEGYARCSNLEKWGAVPRKGGEMRPKWGACGALHPKSRQKEAKMCG
jgi:hypothetical protein